MRKILKHVSKPTYVSRKIFDKCYAAIHEIKPVMMYDFHYNFIKKNF